MQAPLIRTASQASAPEAERGPRKHSAGYLLLLSVCSVSAAFILQQNLTGSFYETNDDFAHAMVLSGALSGTGGPNEHLICPTLFFAQLLKQLYVRIPSVPWYFAFLLGIQWVGCTSLQRILLRRAGTAGGLIAFWAYFVCVQAHLLLSLQFTSTAIFGATIGCLIVLDACAGGVVTAGACVVCAVLFVASAILRSQSCLMGILVGLPCLFLIKAPVKARIAGGIVLALAGAGCYGLQSLSSSLLDGDEHWRDLYSVRAPLFKLIDSAGVGDVPDAPPLRAVGWTVNDGLLLKNFMYCDKEIFSPRKIHAAAAVAPVLRSDVGPEYFLKELSAIATDKTIWAMLILTIAAIAMPGRLGVLSRWRFLVLTVLVTGLMLYLLLCMKLPSRVYFPCLAYLCTISLFALDKERVARLSVLLSAPFAGARKEKMGKVVVVWSCLICCIGLIGKFQYETVLRTGKKLKHLQRETMNCLEALRTRNGIYVTFGNAFPYEFLAPSSNLCTTMSGIRLLPTGGYNNSPWFEDCVRRLNFKGGVLRNLDRPDVYVISSDYFNQFYIKFAEEHLGAKVQMVPIEKFDRINVSLFAVRSDRER